VVETESGFDWRKVDLILLDPVNCDCNEGCWKSCIGSCC